MGLGHIPVIAISFKDLGEENPGFKITPKMLYQAIYALQYGDLLMMCLYRTRPYEVEPGSANRLFQYWMDACKHQLERGVRQSEFRRTVRRIVEDFDEGAKPRVGVVGEILVKFHPTANNQIVDVIEREGCEAVVPGLIEFFLFGIAGGIFAQYIGSLNPAMAGWLQSINYVIMVVFGGMGSLTGSIVSAIALTILPELLRAFSTYRMLVYSVALVLIMIFRPQGIFGNWEFSLTKTINKLFYPMKVKAHGKSKQAESTAKAAKDTAKTDETVETAADTKEAQA